MKILSIPVLCVSLFLLNSERLLLAESPSSARLASETVQKVFSNVPAGSGDSIFAAHKTAKPGDEITLKGRVMGSAKPFVEGRAVFILGDPEKLTACNTNPDDSCKTPWDTCCDPSELIKQSTAVIQIVDAEGKVLKEGIEGVSGLSKLSTVTVTGKVAKGSSAVLLLINASAIAVAKK